MPRLCVSLVTVHHVFAALLANCSKLCLAKIENLLISDSSI